MLACKAQQFEHLVQFACSQGATQRRCGLPDGETGFARQCFHLHDAGSAFLAPQGQWILARQHGVGCEGCVTDEGRFLARCEKPHADVVIAGSGRQHEGGVAVVQFTSDGLHFGIGELPGVEHHAGRISRELFAGESVDLEDADNA